MLADSKIESHAGHEKPSSTSCVAGEIVASLNVDLNTDGPESRVITSMHFTTSENPETLIERENTEEWRREGRGVGSQGVGGGESGWGGSGSGDGKVRVFRK